MKTVVVYRRPGCMFCAQVEEILTEANIRFESREISDRHEQDRLTREHNALAFPLVMVDDSYLGGFTHVVQLHSEGRLRAALLGEAPGERAERKPQPGSMEGYAAFGQLMAKRKK